jgi:glycolate oxidase
LNYRQVTKRTISCLQSLIGDDNVLHDPDELIYYSGDENPAGISAKPDVVVTPQNTQQVSQVLTFANDHRIPVTFRGQGTGLSCGAVPLYGGIVLSFERMNRILEIDEDNLVAIVEPGVVLLTLREELARYGLFYPADPGERTSAIGGNVATNAGGMNGVKYGNTRQYIVGLEAVLASGAVLQLGGKTLKRSTGYELLHLVVGSEGTLAAITKVILRVMKEPQRVITLYVPFPNLTAAIATVPQIIREKITPTAIEFMEQELLLMVEQQVDQRMPHDGAAAYLIIRLDGDEETSLYKMGEAVADLCLARGAEDVLIAESREAQARIWDLRGRFYEVLKSTNILDTVDAVVPISQIAEYIRLGKQISKKYGLTIHGLGHAGDGNVHLMLLKDTLSDTAWSEKLPKTKQELHEAAVALGGTISGEHGIGFEKKKYLPLIASKDELAIMRNIKHVFDPNNILNPGKIFDI